MEINPQLHAAEIAAAKPGLHAYAAVEHCGRIWNLGDLDKPINFRLLKYKLHFKLKHRKEMKRD